MTSSINTLPSKSGRKVTRAQRRAANRRWEQWFDEFWKLGASTLTKMILEWGCDALAICCHMYFYSSRERTEIEVFKAEVGEVGKQANALALTLLKASLEADKLNRRMKALGLDSEAEQIEILSSSLYGATAILAKFWSLKQYGSQRRQGKNYHLLIVDEHVKSVTGSYHRTELAYLAWAATAAHANDPDSVKGISSGAVAKASKDQKSQNSRFFASIQRIAQEYGRWDLIDSLVSSSQSHP